MLFHKTQNLVKWRKALRLEVSFDETSLFEIQYVEILEGLQQRRAVLKMRDITS